MKVNILNLLYGLSPAAVNKQCRGSVPNITLKFGRGLSDAAVRASIIHRTVDNQASFVNLAPV